MSLHKNSGHCDYCSVLFDKYPGFNSFLRGWFESLQSEYPEAHISCAGRGRHDQEMYFHRGASKAHYGKSAHNYNAAIDIFKMSDTVDGMYDKKWFLDIVEPLLVPDIVWYGRDGAVFYELPHIELSEWRSLADKKFLKLVE